MYHVSTQSPPSGQSTLTSLSSFQKPSTTRDHMHLALRPASQRRALRNEQPWRFLAAHLTASSSGPGAFAVRPLRSDCAAYCLQLSLSAIKLSLGVGVGDVLHSWYDFTSREAHAFYKRYFIDSHALHLAPSGSCWWLNIPRGSASSASPVECIDIFTVLRLGLRMHFRG
jgi:hypothetical protein